MGEKYIWATEAQAAEYRKLRDLVVEIVKRYGWVHDPVFDDPSRPESRAVALAEAIKVAGPLPERFNKVTDRVMVPFAQVAVQSEMAAKMLYGTFLKERGTAGDVVIEFSQAELEGRLAEYMADKEDEMPRSKAGEPIRVVPNEQPTVVQLVWRRQTVGYPVPLAFFNVFGKMALTFDQVKAIAEEWAKRNAAEEDGQAVASVPEFFQAIRERDYPNVGKGPAVETEADDVVE